MKWQIFQNLYFQIVPSNLSCFCFLLRKTGIIFFCAIISVYLMKLCKILVWKNTFELCFKNCNQISIRATTGFIIWSHNQIISQQDFFIFLFLFFILIFPDNKLQKTSKSAIWVKLSRLMSPCEIYGCWKQVITHDRPPFYLHFDTMVILHILVSYSCSLNVFFNHKNI